jgi:CHASE3 domain sensor protein
MKRPRGVAFKIHGLVAVLLVLAAGVALEGWHALHTVLFHMERADRVDRIRADIANARALERSFMLSKRPADLQGLHAQLAAVRTLAEETAALLVDPAHRSVMADIVERVGVYREACEQ